MGKLKGGVQGLVSGKVGNLVFSVTGDTQTVRTRPSGPRKFSEGQLAHQASMAIRQKWINGIKDFLKLGFKNNIPYTGGTALALSYMSANAVSGKGEDTLVLSEQMRVSLGELPASPEASVALEGEEAVFQWDPQAMSKASAFDTALVLAYNVEKGSAEYVLEGYFRRDGLAKLALFEPGTYHCYLGFVAKDGSCQSNSQYLGAVEV